MSPATVHYGRAEQAHAERLRVLDDNGGGYRS